MPPRDFRKEYTEKFSEFRQAIKSYENTPENARILAEKYGEIRRITVSGRDNGFKADLDTQDKAFAKAAKKFGEDFVDAAYRVPKSFAQSRIKQFQEELREAAAGGRYDRDQLTQRYCDVMNLAGKSLERKKLNGVENMYYDMRKLVGKDAAAYPFRAHGEYYEMAPDLVAVHKREDAQQKEEARQRRLEEERLEALRQQSAAYHEELNEKLTDEIDAKLEQEQEVNEEQYYNMQDSNAIIKKAFKKENLSERLSAFLKKKEAASETIDEVYADKTVEEREEIEKAIDEDITFLRDLKRHTKRLCEYGQGDDMRPIDNTIRAIQTKFPAQLDRLFDTLSTEKPGSMEHKDRLEMIQSYGSMLVNTQRFANAAAENGTKLKNVEVKDPMAAARDILKKFSTELDRIPKDDENSKLFTSFRAALKRAADGSGSLENLSKASMKYFNARHGRFFRPFTEVGRHRLDVADHVYEFLQDVKYETLEKEAEKWAEAPKAEQPKEAKKVAPSQANLPPEERAENGRSARQNIQNGQKEELISQLKLFGFTSEEIEAQLADVDYDPFGNDDNELVNGENSLVNEEQLQQQQGGAQMGDFI